jgi:hypothetical protein
MPCPDSESERRDSETEAAQDNIGINRFAIKFAAIFIANRKSVTGCRAEAAAVGGEAALRMATATICAAFREARLNRAPAVGRLRGRTDEAGSDSRRRKIAGRNFYPELELQGFREGRARPSKSGHTFHREGVSLPASSVGPLRRPTVEASAIYLRC